MRKKQEITPEFIKQLSYTDFVGFINQWNVLPGSYSTLSKWAIYSRMNKNSRLLEVACTTGFSSRELAYAERHRQPQCKYYIPIFLQSTFASLLSTIL